MTEVLLVSEEVQEAIAANRPVVALESTIFSHLGLPDPSNREALERCLVVIRSAGAVPALTAVLDGRARVGLYDHEHERILGPARKLAARDLPVAIAQRWEVGATTVSATLSLAARVGIEVFATGGIGGVHRDAHLTGDISADLGALATNPVVTTCAGAKAFLDLPRTLEHLEMLGVPVLGWRSGELPAFTSPSSGLGVPHRVESAEEVATLFATSRSLGLPAGLLVTVPIPEGAGLGLGELEAATAVALDEAERAGLRGPAITPFLLDRIASATAGRSISANLSLAEQSTSVAADISAALCRRRESSA